MMKKFLFEKVYLNVIPFLFLAFQNNNNNNNNIEKSQTNFSTKSCRVDIYKIVIKFKQVYTSRITSCNNLYKFINKLRRIYKFQQV